MGIDGVREGMEGIKGRELVKGGREERELGDDEGRKGV